MDRVSPPSIDLLGDNDQQIIQPTNLNSTPVIDLLGDDDPAPVPVTIPPATDKSSDLINLEKLQEAHDKLLHELKEKDCLIQKLHLQLDQQIDLYDQAQSQLTEKENDIVSVTSRINTLLEEKRETEATILKLKQLAVKLKKELADSRDEFEKSKTEQSCKDVTKTLAKENERLSNLYQSTFRNFHNLQADFDKLQDEHDQLVSQKRKLDQDINQAANELSKTRFNLAESKQEIENLTKEVNKLKKETEVSFTKRKEAESKVIVLTNEVTEYKKKLENQAGLERTVNELRIQLGIKTTEIVELSESVEKSRETEAQLASMYEKVAELEGQVSSLKDETDELKEQNWNLTRKLETSTSSNENERLRLIEQHDENKILKDQLEQIKCQSEEQIDDLKKRLQLNEEDLKNAKTALEKKESEFSEYKTKVSIVLSQRSSHQPQLDEMKKTIDEQNDEIQSLTRKLEGSMEKFTSERTARSLVESNLEKVKTELQKVSTDYANSVKECEALKSLSRDLQSRVVSLESGQREKERETKRMLDETEATYQGKIGFLESKIAKLEGEVNAEKMSKMSDASSRSSVHDPESTTLMAQGEQKRLSLSTRDDVDSLASASLTPRTRNFSLSSTSCDILGTNLTTGGQTALEEILNPKHADHSLSSSVELERIRCLLEESEANNTLLSEQIRVLKEEIRRLERTISRTEAANNLEYLKNILVKFVACNTGSAEKTQLIPVIKTLLKLDNQEEKLFCQSISNSSGTPADASGTWTNLLWR